MAAEVFGVPREQIKLINADTALTPDSGIQGASRATFWVGNAVAQAARHLRQEILATAAELLDCAPSDLTLTGECVYCTRHDRRSVTLQEIAHELDRIGKSRKVLGAFEPDLPPANRPRPEYAPFFVTGAQLAEVTVNVRTGEVRVDRVVAAHDVGRAINPVDAKGQVEGSVVMGLGVALMEEYIPGASTGFSDYYVPTIKSMPDIEVILVEVPSFYGPHGAKGLGEAAILPSTPAFVNAVSRAIGARVRHLPATPERVLDALRHASMQPAS
jgi:CO/xanthine dehydrogenase Mo-binding subunit